MKKIAKIHSLLFCCITILTNANAQEIPFDHDKWEITDKTAVILPYLGETTLHMPNGYAKLNEVVFENGIIEVDFAAHGHRGFAGIVFRVQDEKNYELFYFRPHKSRLPDALQYTPVFNGLSAWQLYSNEGYTAPAEIPTNVWTHLKVVVTGTRADFYLNDKLVLEVPELKHGLSKGAIGLWSSKGPVNFANFKFQHAPASVSSIQVDQQKTPEGMLTKWLLSDVYEAATITKPYLPEEKLKTTAWKNAIVEADGLVNISKIRSKFSSEERKVKESPKDVVFAKTIIMAEESGVRKLSFGYSDEICVYLNGQPLFQGNSSFRARDPGFLGIVEVENDAVYLPLKKGENELVLALTETFGGWGFICRLE